MNKAIKLVKKGNSSKKDSNEVRNPIGIFEHKGTPEPIMLQCMNCGNIIGMYSYQVHDYVFLGNYCEMCGAKVEKDSYIKQNPITDDTK